MHPCADLDGGYQPGCGWECAHAEGKTVFGDIDTNGKIDASDALRALQHSVELVRLTDSQAEAADVTADDKVDSSDALLILQHSVGLVYRFPADTLQGQQNILWAESKRVYAHSSAAVEVDGVRTTYQVSGGTITPPISSRTPS